MRVTHSFFTHKGPLHPVNQDSVLEPVSTGETVLFGIADGLGGRPGGEIAASMAIALAGEEFLKHPDMELATLFNEIRTGITAVASADPRLSDMATTLTLCRLSGSKVVVGHAGDTRLYHVRGENIMLHTRDQTEAWRLFEEGLLTEEQMEVHHRRNILLSSLGAISAFSFYGNSFEVASGDRLVLLSDGAYHKTSPREIAVLSAGAFDTNALKIKLEKRVISRRPDDDYTALCVEVR